MPSKLVPCVLALALLGAAPPPEVVPLVPGVPVERTLAAGESHRYSVDVPAGHFLQVTVEQRGVDVELVLLDGGGREVARRDGFYEPGAVDRLSWVIDEPGPFTFTVTAGSGSGAYALALAELRLADPRDHALAAAEALSFQALVRFSTWQSRGDSEHLYAASELWDQALPSWDEAEDPWGEAEALYWSAKTLEALERSSEAAERYERAADLYGKCPATFSTARRQQAHSFANLGVIQRDHGGQLAAAEVSLRTAVSLWEGLGDSVELTVALNNLARVLRLTGHSAAARELFKRSLQLARQHGDPSDEAKILSDLAYAERDLGNPQQALEHLLQGRDVLEAHETTGLTRATILNNLASTLTELGEHETARRYYEQALEINETLGQRDWQAVTLNNLGWLHRHLGQRETARSHLHAALELSQELSLTDTQVDVLDNLAILAMDERSFVEALHRLEQALQLLEDTDRPRQRSILLQDLGMALLEAGRLGEARPPLQESLRLAREIQDVAAESDSLLRLARLDSALGRHSEAWEKGQRALDRLESLRSAIPHPKLRMTLTAARRRAYERVIDVLMAAHAAQPKASWDERAFDTAERARGRGLVELLQEIGVEAQANPELSDLARLLRERLHGLEAHRLQTLDHPGRQEEIDALEAEIDKLLIELTSVEGAIRRQSPSLASLSYPKPLDTSRARSLLDRETVLLSYVVGEFNSYLWVLTDESLHAFSLPARAELASRVERYVSQLSIGDEGHEDGLWLSENLLSPARRWLDRGRRVVIIPDGVLHHLPFGALSHPRPRLRDALEPLLSQHDVTFAPSLTVLDHIRNRPPPPNPTLRVAIVADPIFEADDPRLQPEEDIGTGSNPLQPASSKRGGTARLPWAAREARLLSSLVEPGELLLLSGFAASRDAILTGALSQAGIVHFATHATIHPDHADLARLALSRFDAEGREQAGFLSLADVYGLEIQADLVVLAACDTALGEDLKGEGSVGLTHGFFAAGARRVVSTLWAVDDRATARLMELFYQGLLRDGLSAGQSLRRAQLVLRQQPGFEKPTYWAAFMLAGDW